MFMTPCAQSEKVGHEAHKAMLEALEVTLGNIMSLGPAGALESVPMPYRVWAEVVRSAIERAKSPCPQKPPSQ